MDSTEMGLKKRVLITGCSGYIGSHLCKMLDSEYEVYGIDKNDPQYDLERFCELDINRPFHFEEEFDAVVHLAALVRAGESEEHPIQYYITNLNGTMNVLNKVPTKNFIFASTGLADKCDCAYGISKRAAEDVVREYCTVHSDTPYTIFRFYNVIGTSGFNPTNPDGLMHNLMLAKDTKQFTIFGNDYETPDGTCVRDYIHVDEVCEAIKKAIEQPANQVECLGHGVGYSVREMFEIFERVNAEKIYPLNSEDEPGIALKIGPRRKGDAPYSVLEDVSPYMSSKYTIEDLLRLP